VRRDTGGHDQGAIVQTKYQRRYVPGQTMYLHQCRPRDVANVVVNNADFENPELHFRGAGTWNPPRE
jgi:hypothetical protein